MGTANFFAPVAAAQIAQNVGDAALSSVNHNLPAEDLLRIVAAVRQHEADLSLPREAGAELRAELATIESQASSPQPKQTILRESLLSIRRILESAAGGATAKLIQEIASLLS